MMAMIYLLTFLQQNLAQELDSEYVVKLFEVSCPAFFFLSRQQGVLFEMIVSDVSVHRCSALPASWYSSLS